MRSILQRITLLAAALLIMAVPALADESTIGGKLDQGMQSEKNECLLVAMNCGNQVDSIQQRIDRIKGEIARGTDVYSKDELQRLDRQLEEYTKELNNFEMGS
jgi:predicted nuclease with TOPRIM domain